MKVEFQFIVYNPAWNGEMVIQKRHMNAVRVPVKGERVVYEDRTPPVQGEPIDPWDSPSTLQGEVLQVSWYRGGVVVSVGNPDERRLPRMNRPGPP